MTPRRAGILAAAAALIADQGFKNVMLYGFGFAHLPPAAGIRVLPVLDLVMVWNKGVSYGMFQAAGTLGTVLLTLFALGAIAALSWWMAKVDRVFLAVGLGLIIGGAIGNNLIDRVIYGAVADFFYFHAFGRGWYVFNVADAAITAGVIVLLADAFIRPETKDSDREPVSRN